MGGIHRKSSIKQKEGAMYVRDVVINSRLKYWNRVKLRQSKHVVGLLYALIIGLPNTLEEDNKRNRAEGVIYEPRN